MRPRPCPACGGADVGFERDIPDADGRPQRFALARCAACGLGYVDPVPDDIASLYPEGFYWKPSALSALAQRIFLSQRARVVRDAGVTSGRLLDVGAGAGDFLAEMSRRGFACTGMEPSDAGRRRAGAFATMVASLDELDGQTFDIVTAWHSIEHMPEPLDALQMIRRLVPHGVLVIAVPNAGSLEARLFRDRWFHLDVPRHLQQLTMPALEALLSRAGFRIDATRRFSVEYDVYGLTQSVLNLVPGERNALFKALKHGRRPRDVVGRTRLAAMSLALPSVAAASTLAELALSAAHGTGTITAICR